MYFGVSSSEDDFLHATAITEGDDPPIWTTQGSAGQGGSVFPAALDPTYKAIGYNTGDSEWIYWSFTDDGWGSDGDNNGIIRGADSEGALLNPAAYVQMNIYIIGPTLVSQTTFPIYFRLIYTEEV